MAFEVKCYARTMPLAKSQMWQRPNRPHGAGVFRPPLGSGAAVLCSAIFLVSLGSGAHDARSNFGYDANNDGS